MSEEEKLNIAIDLLRQGRCTDNVLRKYGVPQKDVYRLIIKAEAWYVNQVTQLFPKPPQYKEQDHGPERRHL